MNRKIIVGSRPSKMAQAMSLIAKDIILRNHPEIEIEHLTFVSEGDKHQGDLRKIGGKGSFINDLEQRLLNKEIDFAIHCLKDIPGDIEPNPDLVICSFLERYDPRDALILREGVTEVKEGMVIATSSLRRRAQLHMLYPNITVIPLRGNVDTRLRKLNEGQFDGIVISYSGLEYLQMTNIATKIFDFDEMLPAVGQGVLCVQLRREDLEKCPYLSETNSNDTEMSVVAERTMLNILQGNCFSAIAGHCAHVGDNLKLTAAVFTPDGKTALRYEESQNRNLPAKDLGIRVANKLLGMGARDIIITCDGFKS